MGTYIGHCESCDITLEAEDIIGFLESKGYNEEKIQKILAFTVQDYDNMVNYNKTLENQEPIKLNIIEYKTK